jgi:signal transduction histidine kinase
MARGVTHDCNNFLSAIKGNAFILKHTAAGNNNATEPISQIENCTDKAMFLMNKLLVYTGNAPFTSQQTEINTLIEDSCKKLCPPHINIPKIIFDFKYGLPTTNSDQQQLSSLMQCLLTNSVEAMVECTGSITVTTGLIKKNDAKDIELTYPQKLSNQDHIFIQVKDRGKGIPMKIQKKMFTPFFTTKIRGEGLGLNIILGVIRAHSGGLIVNSLARNGSTFTAIIPITR